MSVGKFWQTTTPVFVGILLLIVIVIVWNCEWAIRLGHDLIMISTKFLAVAKFMYYDFPRQTLRGGL